MTNERAPKVEKSTLPNYDPVEQGIDADLREVPLSSQRRRASTQRYTGHNQTVRSAPAEGTTTADAVRELLNTTTEQRGHVSRNDRAVIYLRVSTEEQARVGGTAEGYSIPYQRDACYKKAADLGLSVVEEYVDAGHSAKSANRPDLQRLMRELKALGVGYVIVHKIDRLARNTRDDHLINDAIRAAGARLVSVVDLVDDSPQGRFNYTIQAGLAQLYSDNLAVEVLKGLSKKAQLGGTPYRAPIGYLNKRRFEGVADIRWIEVDPERAPLIRWAFEEYATGTWSLARLRLVLIDKGLTNFAGKPVSINGLHKILTNAYYTGIVPFRGAYYEGTHEPLVDLPTWLSVQGILQAHNFAGEKAFKHAHYLKGSVWCGGCGSRLIFSRNKGKLGTSYDYFVCVARHRKRNDCTRRAISVARAEEGISVFYEQFAVLPEHVAEIQEAVGQEFARLHAVAETDRVRSHRRLERAQDQRRKLLQAHYDDAVPRDVLKTEMQRLTAEIGQAEAELASAQTSLLELEGQLDRALHVAEHCSKMYEPAPKAIRRQINQGFFEKLYLDEDGTVARVDLTEPFTSLLALTGSGTSRPADAAQTALDDTGGKSVQPDASDGVVDVWDVSGDVKTPGHGGLTRGSNVDYMAEAEGFEPPDGCPSSAFKADAFGRSATLPWGSAYRRLLGGSARVGASLARAPVDTVCHWTGHAVCVRERYSGFSQFRGVVWVV